MKGFLFNPVVADQKKRDLLSSLANDAGLSKHTLNFLNLLLDQASALPMHLQRSGHSGIVCSCTWARPGFACSRIQLCIPDVAFSSR